MKRASTAIVTRRLAQAWATLGLSLIALFASRSARADDNNPATLFILPLEAGHAAAWTPERAGPVYKASVALLPGAMLGYPGTLLGRFAISAVGQFDYRNPDWDVGVGGRLSGLIVPIINFIPVKAAAEATYLVRGHGARLAFGPMFGLGRLLQVSTFYGYETDRKTHFGYVGMGIDLAAVGDLVGAATWYVPQGDGGYAVK